LRRFPNAIKPGTNVVLTAKIDGSNGRFVHSNGRFYVGSHKVIRSESKSWLGKLVEKIFRKLGKKKDDVPSDIWHRVAEKYDLEEKLSRFPEIVVYGEVYGKNLQVRGGKPMSYDSPDEASFRV